MSSARSPASTASKCAAASSLWNSAICGAAAMCGLVDVALGVEHPQRVAVERGPRLLAEPLPARLKCARSAST
jgi:hypothetical protein